MINKQTIRAYALKNAIEHSGEAKQGAVINSLFSAGLKKPKLRDYLSEIQETIKKVNSMKLEEQKT